MDEKINATEVTEEMEFEDKNSTVEMEREDTDSTAEQIPGDIYSCEIIIVPRDRIVTNEDNKNCGYSVEDDISELAMSIRDYGLGDPLNVIPQDDGTYFLVGGHRRIRALQYGDEQGWNWFKNGYPCIISTSPIKKDNDLDRKIYIHELNIHNRDNSTNYFELVQNLLDLYRQKYYAGYSDSKATKRAVKMLSNKLGITLRQGYKIAYIAESADEWIRCACNNNKITKDCAHQIAHMPAHFQEELHKYFDEHGCISKEIMEECAEQKFIEEAPDWLRDAIDNNVISRKMAYKIGFSTRESQQKLEEYYLQHHTLPADIISSYMTDKKGNTISVQDVKNIEQKAFEEQLIDSVATGKVNLKQYRDPMEFDVEGLNMSPSYVPPECSDYEETESFNDDGDTSYEDEHHSYGHKETYPSSSAGSYPSAGYYGYESHDYEAGEDDFETDEFEENYENEFENSDADDYDMGISEETFYSKSERSNSCNDNAKTSSSTEQTSKKDDEGISGRSKELIMSDSAWWFGQMAQKGQMNETESIYIDMMFSLMEKFYFPRLVQMLQTGSVADDIKEILKELVTMVSPYIEITL